jgi:flagellar motor switch protein FliN/FliY
MTEESAIPAEVESTLKDAAAAISVQASQLEELSPGDAEGGPIGLDSVLEVPVRVTVEIGRTRMPLSELVELGPGSLITLDREAHEPADILVNGKIVARGEVVTVDGTYGVRITRVLG